MALFVWMMRGGKGEQSPGGTGGWAQRALGDASLFGCKPRQIYELRLARCWYSGDSGGLSDAITDEAEPLQLQAGPPTKHRPSKEMLNALIRFTGAE